MSVSAERTIPGAESLETCGCVTRVERRLIAASAILIAAAVLMLGPTIGHPVAAYLGGAETTVVAVMDGAGCGSHLEWTAPAGVVRRGTTVHFENQTVYWQIPIVIERLDADGTSDVVATAPPIKDGERWSHTFWRSGDYRVVSAQEVQQLAGLDMRFQVAR
jgi:hypothetical protein